jgi:hypothetical protein
MSRTSDRTTDSRPVDDAGPVSSQERGLDAVFDALEHRARRSVVEALSAMDLPIDVDRLATVVESPSDRRDAPPIGDPGTSTADALQQVHLPLLERLGVVRYDRDRGTVRTASDVTWLVALLAETDRFDGR